MNGRADPTPDAEYIASAIRDAVDPSGLRDAAETVADAIGDTSADGGKASVTRAHRRRDGKAVSAIPAELRALPQWVRWKSVPDTPKPRKIPIRPADPGCASSTDPSTWGTFEEASANVGKHGTCGIGFVFTKGDPYVGIDLDDCVNEEGVTNQKADALIEGLSTYVEMSPSGTGVHIIGRGSLNGHGGLTKKKQHGIEIYDTGRYFTMTGLSFGGTSRTVDDCQAALDALVAKLDPPKPAAPRPRRSDYQERARAYVAKMPPAISGKGGHLATFAVALTLVKGFSLDSGTALDLLREFNSRCEPPWSEKDLMHKIEDAGKAEIEDGYIIERDAPRSRAAAPSEIVAPRATLATFTALALDGMDIPAPRYVCADLVVEGLSLLAGKPKLGKSWLALQLGIAVPLGETWLGRPCERGEVLYLALEDSKRRLQSRVRIVLDHRRLPPGLTFSTECPRLDEGGLDLISEWLAAHPDARLVIIDTLAKVKPHRKRNGDISAEDNDAGSRLQVLAFKHRVAVLVVHHTRKAGSEDFLEEVAGTFGLTGAADSILVLRRDRQAAEGTLSVTGRDIEECELALSFAPGALWTARGEAGTVPVTHERRDVLEVLLAAKRDSSRSPALSTGEIAKSLGKGPTAVSNLLTKMAAEGQAHRGVKFGTWLPGDGLTHPMELVEPRPDTPSTASPKPPSTTSTASTPSTTTTTSTTSSSSKRESKERVEKAETSIQARPERVDSVRPEAETPPVETEAGLIAAKRAEYLAAKAALRIV